MISRLLVGLDGSPIAELVLPYVETFARATNAPVTLVRCITPEKESEPLPDENPKLLPFMVVMPTERAGAETESERNAFYDAQHYLDRIVQRLGDNGVVAEARVIKGQPAKVLVEEALAQPAGLILLCTHGRSGLGKLIYGSVAEAVIAQSPLPVLLVRAWKGTNGSAVSLASAPILVPLDGTPTGERALPIASELAKLFSTELKLVEVVPSISAYSLTESAWLMGEPEDIQAEEQGEAKTYLGSVARRLQASGIATTGSVRAASISAGITSEVSEVGAGLIVLATHATSPLAQALVRSVATEVLHQARQPILLIGPQVALADSEPNSPSNRDVS
jgi:nucleotide-binding universal stress UspA family protein